MSEDPESKRFYQSWAWKREHLPDRYRFHKPYTHTLAHGGPRIVSIKQARFKAEGFASTVWDSSIVVSKYLEKASVTLVQGRRCLDLSAGCGLIAVVLSQLGASQVVATDLDANLQLLRENCSAVNAAAEVTVLAHAWGQDMEALLPQYDLIVACDVMYISEAVPDLVATLNAACSPSGRVLMAHGRNRGGETALMEEVRGMFDVAEVPSCELHDVYQCSDVAVYCLTRTKLQGLECAEKLAGWQGMTGCAEEQAMARSGKVSSADTSSVGRGTGPGGRVVGLSGGLEKQGRAEAAVGCGVGLVEMVSAVEAAGQRRGAAAVGASPLRGSEGPAAGGGCGGFWAVGEVRTCEAEPGSVVSPGAEGERATKRRKNKRRVGA